MEPVEVGIGIYQLPAAFFCGLAGPNLWIQNPAESHQGAAMLPTL